MGEKLTRIDEFNCRAARIENYLDKIRHEILGIEVLLEKELGDAMMKREYVEGRIALNKRIQKNRINEETAAFPDTYTVHNNGSK